MTILRHVVSQTVSIEQLTTENAIGQCVSIHSKDGYVLVFAKFDMHSNISFAIRIGIILGTEITVLVQKGMSTLTLTLK